MISVANTTGYNFISEFNAGMLAENNEELIEELGRQKNFLVSSKNTCVSFISIIEVGRTGKTN